MGCSCSSTSDRYVLNPQKKKKKKSLSQHSGLLISKKMNPIIKSKSCINILDECQIPIIFKRGISKSILNMTLKLAFQWRMGYRYLFRTYSHQKSLNLLIDRNFLSGSLSDHEVISLRSTLCKLIGLNRLDISFIRGSMESSTCFNLFKFLKSLKRLKALNLTFFRMYSENDCHKNPISLKYLKSLTHLRLGIFWSDVLDDKSIPNFFQGLNRLQNIRECILNIRHPRFTHEGFNYLFPSLARLKNLKNLRLILSEDDFIVYDKGIDLLSESFMGYPMLEKLSFKLPSNEIITMHKYIKFIQYMGILKNLSTFEVKVPTRFNGLMMNDLFYALKALSKLKTFKIIIYADNIYKGNSYIFDISCTLKSITHFQLSTLNNVKINYFNLISQLMRMPSLDTLVIDDPAFEVDDIQTNPNCIEVLTSLKKLEMRTPDSSLNSLIHISSVISSLHQLEALNILYDSVLLFRELVIFDKLRELELTFVHFSCEVILGSLYDLAYVTEKLKKLTKLKLNIYVDFQSDTKLLDAVSSVMGSSIQLKSFSLSVNSFSKKNSKLTDDGLAKLEKGISRLENLKELNLELVPEVKISKNITDIGLNKIFSSVSKLKKLYFFKFILSTSLTKPISGIYIGRSLSEMLSLRSLHVEFNGMNFSGDTQKMILKRIASLINLEQICLKFDRNEYTNLLESNVCCDKEFI